MLDTAATISVMFAEEAAKEATFAFARLRGHFFLQNNIILRKFG
ncbi:hypothetical protein [Treponema primitia]